jgi:hypothetical protein
MFERNENKDTELTPQFTAFERRLAQLDVAPLHVDRDRLMFDAGRAAGREDCFASATGHRPKGGRVAGAPRWFWPSAAAMTTAACLSLAAMLVWWNDAALVAQGDAKPQADAEVETQIAPPEAQLAVLPDISNWAVRPAGGYLEKRYIALTRGVGELRPDIGDGISHQPGGSAQPATARELLRELVPHRALPHSNS